ncbi:YncE family protein [uncultured Winogradskyella sp.]|uniref:YncE family protein n=1 Tax=uncultured Winogradskyella sp. TaxID=395353 RepID=UPI0030DA62AE|tara:strand:+ start:14042 stop:15643 length:1602 start_codon:yes stop_codon:yes gene_type:complete
MRRAKYNWFDKQAAVRNYYQQLQKDNDVTQITVTNHTDDIRKVCLWGAISCVPLTDPMFLEGVATKTIIVEKHPQELIYNPVTDLFYVINQLSDSVSVVNTSGAVVTTIDLYQQTQIVQTGGGSGVGERTARREQVNPLKSPGTISPAAIAVNTKSDSAEYGMIAVACSVSNEVVFINTSNTIERRETVGKRPIDITYNPVDDCYYTTNLVSGTISKICINRRVNNLPPIEAARTIGVNTDNGDLYIHSLKDGSVNIYDVQGNLKGSVGSVRSEIVSFLFHPVTKNMYMVLNGANTVVVLDTTRFVAIRKINTGNDPVEIAYNINNGLMYIGNRGDQTFTRIDAKHQVIDTIKSESFGVGLAISTKDDIVAVSNSANDTVTISGIQGGPTVTVNDEYYEYREDFQHNPTLISHLKIVASGEDRINALQLIEKSAAGKESCQTLSLSNHQSPQNFGNISEVFNIDGDIIDGHSIWCFKINPKQVVTFLIYHKQFEMYNMLPDKTRISTGVQMSEGIPASWLEYNENEPPDESAY